MMTMFTIIIMYLCAWVALWLKGRFNKAAVNYVVGFIAVCTVILSVKTLKKPGISIRRCVHGSRSTAVRNGSGV